tara:strand:- start:6 stop:179 length:174 start_codon:yes stop_codon:yes gene_type:complete
MSKKNMFTQRHYIAIVEVLNKYKDDMTGINIYNDMADLFKNDNEKFNNEIFKKAFLK